MVLIIVVMAVTQLARNGGMYVERYETSSPNVENKNKKAPSSSL